MTMDYEPEKHHRQSIRMKGYDYTLPGAYYLTIVSHRRACIFGAIEKGEISLNEIGQTVKDCWNGISDKFQRIEFDKFVLMPNHLHGIFFINEADG
jgi:REP element-mobilizing transposase RayT